MQGFQSIHTVAELMAQPQVRAAQVLQLTFPDLVHFRVSIPGDVYALVERRLALRSAETFAGYAETRSAVESTLRGAELKAKIDSCCVRRPDWLPFRQILQSVELETWMDLSYPTAFGLGVYQAAIQAGKAVHVPREGQFHPLFLQFLLEKNGYELTHGEAPAGALVKVHIGPPVSARAAALSLVPPEGAGRPHPLERGNCPACRLAAGILQKDMEYLAARGAAEGARHIRHLGYRLAGPALAVFFQALQDRPGAVAPVGAGAAFLRPLGQDLQRLWPWLPTFVDEAARAEPVSLLPERGSALSLVPAAIGSNGAARSVFEASRCGPETLVLQPLHRLFAALLEGPAAAPLSAAAAAFARDYAFATRGLCLRLPPEPVLEAWREELLNPDPAFIAWVSSQRILPGLERPRTPWRTRSQLTSGPWPSASYRLAKGVARASARWVAPATVRLIEAGLAGDWQAG